MTLKKFVELVCLHFYQKRTISHATFVTIFILINSINTVGVRTIGFRLFTAGILPTVKMILPTIKDTANHVGKKNSRRQFWVYLNLFIDTFSRDFNAQMTWR